MAYIICILFYHCLYGERQLPHCNRLIFVTFLKFNALVTNTTCCTHSLLYVLSILCMYIIVKV